jgi:chromosome partitioning protein
MASMNGKIIAYANQKGGVGKTTSAVNIGAYTAEAGKRVLLLDFDPQGNLASSVGADKEKPGAYEVLTGQVSLDEAVQKTVVPNLFVVPSNIDLAGADVELMNQPEREFFLKRALAGSDSSYDYIFIDCPPSLGLLTLNGLTASDLVFIPMQCEYFAMEGLSLLLQSIRRVQKALNPGLGIGGIFFTMYDSRTRLANEVVQEVAAYFKDKVFKTIIPRNVRLSEAPSHGVPISLYDSGCIGAASYKKLAQEVIERV